MIGDTEVSLDYGSGINDAISLTVIPEPRAAALVLGLLCLIFARQRAKARRQIPGD